MSGRKKWSDVKHKCTPEQLAKARAELEDEMRAYEATPTQSGAPSEGNDEEPDFRQLRDAARRGRRCANCLYPDACARTDTCRAAVQRLKVARGGIPAVNAPESVLSEAARLVDGDRQTAYLAGPMRGLPDYNFPAFHAAAADLRDRGYTVLSPAEGDVHDGFNPETGDGLKTFKEYMQRDLALVCSADLVVVLPGWQKSQGARLEVQVANAVGIPVLRYPDLKPARHPSSERFHRLLGKLAETHDRKAADYGTDGDSLANVRACEQNLGIPAWVGVEIRIGDKNQRIASFLAKGELENESIEDSVLDRAVYSLIQLVLFEEAAEGFARNAELRQDR